MRPILDLIVERETAANTVATGLREQIATLAAELALAETEITELAITGKTLRKLTGQAEPPPQADTTGATTAYQKILTVFGATTGPMRAKDVCLALGTAATRKDVERLRTKLKRLAARQILTETEPGLFTLTSATPPA